MKKIIIMMLFSSSVTWAGDKVNNGGGLWTCEPNGQITQGVLVDLYEAQEEFGLTLISSRENDPMRIVEERKDFIRTNLPEYFYAWNQVLADAVSRIRWVQSELVVIDDALFRLTPPRSSCREGWKYTQFANYTKIQNQILVRSDLWNHSQIASLDKAALIWHEVVYKWLRDQFQDEDSVRARQIVGLLFSTLPVNQMKEKIIEILKDQGPNPVPVKSWICQINNPHQSLFYSGYGLTKTEARAKSLQACQAGPSGFFCSESSNKCEEIVEQRPIFSCENRNVHSGKVHLGVGRSKLEAEFKSRDACQKADGRTFCADKVTCE